ncbi:hypothetical protein C5B96_02340 [Subtercola sp. Z020]|uniref:hypothetical protein n=1 Tax=Subtercola sp. Z020 TaxID=2080582 RepID=UPI000CE72028|nr:hypothetical protein [Subtercola sp. Z020]PPF88690.1 hypothetical protein C5B96_02340 [Subtercola sp. Z020]
MKRTPPSLSRSPLRLLLAGALSALLSALLAVAATLGFSPSASALPAVAHGVGYLWNSDGRSWLGSHRLADGQLGLCLQVQNAPPEGSELEYGHASTAGWYSADDLARLAYIGRWWAASTNPGRAAAAQLTTWGITGLNGHGQAWFAQRANGDAGGVLALAQSMRAQLDSPGGASRGVVAKLSLSVPSDEGGTVSSELVADYLAGGPTQLPRAAFRGTLTLSGATFDDGSTVRDVTNGEKYSIIPSKGTALNRVTADIAYFDLPFGADAYIAKAPAGIQSLLVPPARNTGARARAHAGDVSPLPFRPAVVTETSAGSAETGAYLSDTLRLKVAGVPKVAREGAAEPSELPTSLDEWGVYRDADGALQPVPVVVRSTLWGPLDAQPDQQPTVPPHTPLVCTVATRAEDGPGEYETPDCILPAPGYYVWTETIDPADTPVEKGGGRLTAWASSFGAASEMTFAVAPPPPPPVTPTPTPTAPTPPPTAQATPTPTATPPGVVLPPSTSRPPTPGFARTSPELASTGLAAAGVPFWAASIAIGSGILVLAFVLLRRRALRRRS